MADGTSLTSEVLTSLSSDVLTSPKFNMISHVTAEETATYSPASMVVSHQPPTTSRSQMAGGNINSSSSNPDSPNQLYVPNPTPTDSNNIFRRIHEQTSVIVDSPGAGRRNHNNIGLFSGGWVEDTLIEERHHAEVLSPIQKSGFFPVQNGMEPDPSSPVVPMPECGLGTEVVLKSPPAYSQECTEDVDHYFGYDEGKHWVRGELLGRGVSGTCYVATDVETRSVMVVKQISVTKISDVLSEVDLMRRIKHQNIVQFYGATRSNQHLNIFMELMEGGSLEERLRYGVFQEDKICSFSQQLVSGVSYLHGRGVVHRDLKGANLLTDALGQSLRISDFGSAASLTDHHKFYQVAGTPAFIAPEVVRACQATPYGPKCDVWGVGCVAIEMATASPPWILPGHRNPHRYEVLFKIGMSDRPPPIPHFHREELRDFVVNCLRLSHVERPSSAELLHHQLMKLTFS